MIVAFKPHHLESLRLQDSQAVVQPMLADPTYGESLVEAGPAYSAVDGDAVFACAGLFPLWDGRACAWALIAAEAGQHFVAIHKAVRRALTLHAFRRVETVVRTDFAAGHRWARMLGFQREATMRGYAPDGHDYDLYARVTYV